MRSESCDIFCNVVDNFGDIGVCWRLAKQLANEHDFAVRLWVDDLDSFAKLCPQADSTLASQQLRGVDVRLWRKDFPETQPADLVIEAFACKLPQNFIEAMAAQEQKPVWINLEYLSAEDWVESHHKLPSPHPTLPLTKYFFFPGFTRKSGGLLLERDLLARRNMFDSAAFWRDMGIQPHMQGEVRVSLFSYENPMLAELFDVWANSPQPLLCLVPEGRILPQVKQFFGITSYDGPMANTAVWQRGNLCVQALPFVKQERYDELLWACDINFVRGEDSFVRAQWAGKPFIWHIYPQSDGAHMLKLHAFMEKYAVGLPPDAVLVLNSLCEAWNGKAGSLTSIWNDFLACQSILLEHSGHWAKYLAENNLALNLLDFFEEIGRMRAIKMEG